jgi:2-C-methyl-D-erythritol 4-phosphate cytidylyltransferase
MKATAILAAAGSGERLGSEEPKAFVHLAGRPMVGWSLAALSAASAVDRVLVAVPEGYTEHPALTAADPVPGGASRSESVANALARVESDLVVVHDAARPLASPELFDETLATLSEDSELAGVVAATRVADTTKEVLRGNEVHRTLDRSSLWAAQTPQAFRTEALRGALESTQLLAQASDDAMLVERNGGRVLVHEAPAENFKVTTDLDLRLAEHLLEARGRARSD